MSSIAAVEQPLFIKKKHELADLLKQVERGSKDAVELIVTTMNETDEKIVPLKTRLECAKALLEMQIKISAEISRDQLTRQVAEIRKHGMATPLGLEAGAPKRIAPSMNFDMVQKV